MCLCEISYMKVPTSTCDHCRVMNAACGSALNCSRMLFKDRETNRALLHKIFTLHHPRINVCTYNGSPLMTRLGLSFKAVAAAGMHWAGAERTAPMNAPALTASTKQTLKRGGGEEEYGGGGEEEVGVWELSLPTVQLIQIGLQPPVAVYFDAYKRFLKEKRGMVVK